MVRLLLSKKKCFSLSPTHLPSMLPVKVKYVNPNSLDNKGSWRILKDFYCSVTMLRELGLKGRYNVGNVVRHASMSMLTLFE